MHMLRHVLGWGGVNVHVNLPHMQMLRHVLGLGGVNVHVNLPHMHMLRRVLGWGVLTVNVHVTPMLMRSTRIWQWCWMNSKAKNLLEVTGSSLSKRMAMWKEEYSARVFNTKVPVNCSRSSKMHFKSPGKFKPFLGTGSIVSLWQKRHFF